MNGFGVSILNHTKKKNRLLRASWRLWEERVIDFIPLKLCGQWPSKPNQLDDRVNLGQEDNSKMKTLSTILFAITLSLGLTVVALAQTPAPTPGKRTPVATKRQENQQKRIRQGVASGELKKGEVRKLEKEQKEVHQEKKEARADGTVTAEERKEIHKEQNEASRKIYRAKHNNRKRN